MERTNFDLVIVGVGGQGTLLASKIIGALAMGEGLGVKVSEVHGMSQRGGSVITHVRVGEDVYAPLVSEGQADFLLAFEALEAARAAAFLGVDGLAVVSSQRIFPMPVITGESAYPEDPVLLLEGHRVEVVNALEKAVDAGSSRAVNLVLLGALSKHLPFMEQAWTEAITASVPPNTLPVNERAFYYGRVG